MCKADSCRFTAAVTQDTTNNGKPTTGREHAIPTKLCLRGAQTCVQSLFFNCDLELKPPRHRDIPIMYLHTKNKAASLRHSKLRA